MLLSEFNVESRKMSIEYIKFKKNLNKYKTALLVLYVKLFSLQYGTTHFLNSRSSVTLTYHK